MWLLFSPMMAVILRVTWQFMTPQPGTLTSDKEIFGVARDIAPHALLTKFTGKADALRSLDVPVSYGMFNTNGCAGKTYS